MHKEQCPTQPPLRLQLLEYDGALSELRVAWSELHGSCESTPFLRWEWVRLWWDIYRARGDRLHLLAVREGNRLVAIAPLYLQAAGPVSSDRCLRILGTGEPEREEVCSEYLDLLIRPGWRDPVIELIAEYLRDHGHRWRSMRFDRVLPSAHLDKLIRQLRGRYAVLSEAHGVRHRVTLPDSWEAWEDGLGNSMRSKLRRSERRLGDAGGYRAIRPSDADQAEQMLDTLTRLHAKRWAAQGRSGVFAAPRFNAFHRRLSRSLFAENALQLRLYALDGLIIAGFYGLRDHGTTYYYQSGFDPLRSAPYSPLVVAHSREIRQAIERGDRYYDFLRGPEDSYKAKYGCELTPVSSYRLAPHGAASVGFGLRRARNWLRRQRLERVED